MILPKIVSERLGHASVAITLDTYSHVLPSMQRAVAESLDFGPSPTPIPSPAPTPPTATPISVPARLDEWREAYDSFVVSHLQYAYLWNELGATDLERGYSIDSEWGDFLTWVAGAEGPSRHATALPRFAEVR